ncbi:MAG: FAD-dependent oxidoreductase [Verrucomicrobia bacterium]|nr:FAD-dependent oxidoreductase [Verrucomicrobiota bacterium]
MNRRAFLTSLGAASAGGAVSAAEPSAHGNDNSGLHEVRNYRSRPLPADVLVIGGGTAGTIAAIQAGRLGARTILVEAGSQLGGTTTTAGVDFPGLFHAWGKQVIAGIGWDLVARTVELNSDDLPDFTKPTGSQHWKHQVRLCGALYAALAEEACVKAGVQLRYYEFPIAIEQTAAGWKVQLAGKGTQVEVAAKQLVDCTGNASAVGMIGLPRQRDKTTQPGSLIYRLGGYDAATLDMSALQAKAATAVKAGTLKLTDVNGNIAGFLRSGGENAMHVPGADSSTSETHTATNIRGRQSLLRVMRFLKQQPGFAGLCIERLQPETGVRETFRIVGETTVTVNDYVAGRVFDDAVAYSFYPIDLHVEHGVRPEHLKEGVVPTIPRGALVPKGSKNLMVAGRCLSSDRLANSALRVQASCMAMGQAAGVTAALAARAGTTPSQVAMLDIRHTLAEHGAIVPKTT